MSWIDVDEIKFLLGNYDIGADLLNFGARNDEKGVSDLDSPGSEGVHLRRLKQIATILMVLFVFFNAIPRTTTIKEVCFYLSSVIFAVTFVLFRDRINLKSTVFGSLCVYALWASVSFFWTLDKVNTLHHLVWHLLKGLVLYSMIVHFVKTKKDINLLGLAVVMSSLFISFLLMYKHFVVAGASFTDKLGTYYPELAVNWIAYTVVFAIAVILSFLAEKRGLCSILFSMAILGVFALVIYLTQSRAAVLSMFVAVLLMSVVTNKKIVLLLVAVAISIICYGPVGKRFEVDKLLSGVRTSVNYTSFEIMKDYPFGVGYGAEIYGKRLNLKKYNALVPAKYKKHNKILSDPHSLLFSIGVRLGFVGVILFFGVVLSFLVICLQMIRSREDIFVRRWGMCVLASFVGFLAVAFVEPAGSHYVDNVFFTILATGTSVWRLQYLSICS